MLDNSMIWNTRKPTKSSSELLKERLGNTKINRLQETIDELELSILCQTQILKALREKLQEITENSHDD